MAQRLPTPGQDDGTWGDILNGYLQVSLDASGNLLTSAVSAALPSPIPTSKLATNGTASSSTFLRGDGTWATPSGGGTVTSVTATDGTITVGGTANAPTLGVNAIAESKVTGLIADLNAKANTSSLATVATSGSYADLSNKPTGIGNMTAGQVAGGNLGSAYTLSLPSNYVQFTGTLTANCALTISGLTTGSSAVLLLEQDGTGGRALTINGASVTVPSTAGSAFDILLWSPDGTNIYIQPGPQTGATGATGSTGPRGSDWFTYSGGGTPTGITGMVNGDYCLRTDGEVFTYASNAWTDTSVNIKGATGPTGPSGAASQDSLRLNAWGVLAEPYPVGVAVNSSTMTSGRLEGALVGLASGVTATGILIGLTTNAATLTHLWAVLLNGSGLVLAASADSPNALNSGTATINNVIQIPFSSPYTIPSSGGYYAGLLATTSSGTMPGVARGGGIGMANAISGGTLGTGLTLFVAQTGVSSLPTVGSGSFSSLFKEATSYWVGIY